MWNGNTDLKEQVRVNCLKEQAKQRNDVTEHKKPIVWFWLNEGFGLLIDVNKILLSLARKQMLIFMV